jgi:hypothetical protein
MAREVNKEREEMKIVFPKYQIHNINCDCVDCVEKRKLLKVFWDATDAEILCPPWIERQIAFDDNSESIKIE